MHSKLLINLLYLRLLNLKGLRLLLVLKNQSERDIEAGYAIRQNLYLLLGTLQEVITAMVIRERHSQAMFLKIQGRQQQYILALKVNLS